MQALSSIRSRVTAAFTLAVALLMLSTCGLVLVFAHTRSEHEKAEALHSAARDFVVDVGHGGRKAALTVMDMQDADLRARGILLVLRNENGHEVAEVGGHRRSARAAGQRLYTVRVGSDTAAFSLSWGEERRNLLRLAAELGVVTLVVIIAAGLGAWGLVGHTLSPIRALSRQANAASVETLSVRLAPPSDDAEVLELVRTLNVLLDRVSESAAARGRFNAAASHELRTPLQALLGHLELGSARDRSPEEYRAILAEASRQANRLIGLTRDLLFLSRLQSGAVESAPEPVDLGDVVERMLNQAQPIATRRRITVRREVQETVTVHASPGHVDMMVRNLIENAVKYATAGGMVRVSLSSEPPSLTVQNDAAPLAQTDMDRLFEPFYRPDADRNSETGGNGLGLPICRAIADADGWNFTLEQHAGAFRAVVIFA